VIIDFDRVEEHNIGTQVYAIDDVGGLKADLLRNMLVREVGTNVESVPNELTERTIAKSFKGANLVVDTFDNTRSRALVSKYCADGSIACVHAGVNGEYGEAKWNDCYRVPSDQGVDACDYPLARNLITIVAGVACEVIVRFLLEQRQEDYSITLGDLSINREG
jgi:molybdopterin/thiamine biosynthesis adenylyltransferase